MLDTLRQQLRQGVAIRSPFDPLSFPAYMIIAIAAIVGAILMAFTGFSFDFRLALSLATWSGALFVAAWLLRSVNHPRLAGAIEAGTLLVCQGFAFLFILYPLAGLSGPYADMVLARADAALGFNWSSFAIVLAQHWLLLRIGLFAYSSFEWQPILIVAALALCRLERRMWTMVAASSIGLAITSAIFPFFPAEGALRHFGLTAASFTALPRSYLTFDSAIHLIKDGGVRHIDTDLLTGIVSFPSYHTTAAVIYAWACWPIRILRWPSIVLNVAMATAAIPIGVHYLVDILAGAAVGIIATSVAGRLVNWPRHAGLVSPILESA